MQWRERVAREKRAAYADEDYWGRPVPGWGDPAARVVVFGLAPAAHGANRTGRMFTGDRSGDFLFAALHRTGFAASPVCRVVADDPGLRDVWITAAVRCAPPANKPTPVERDRCIERFARPELGLLPARVLVCLGAFAWDAALRTLGPGGAPPRPKPKFGHGAEVRLGEHTLVGCFHVSQQNTFTGTLTEAMIDAALERARELAGLRR